MNNNRLNEIKKEDKKAFAFVVVISALIGAISVHLKEIIGENIPDLLGNIFDVIVPFASLILSVLVIAVSTVIYTNSRKEYELWKDTEEDNNIIDKIEKRLSYIILFTSVNMILRLFFLGMGWALLNFTNVSDGFITCFLIGFLLSMASSILIQKKIVIL